MMMHIIRRAAAALCLLALAGAAASADVGPDRLEVFAAGASGASTPQQSLRFPTAIRDVAVDGRGEIYLTDPQDDSLMAYAPRLPSTGRADGTLQGAATQIVSPSAIALDARGDLYVANEGRSGEGAGIAVFPVGARGDVAPTRIIAGSHTLLTDPVGVAVDSRGLIYVVDAANKDVLVFSARASGDASPTRKLAVAGFAAREIAIGPDDDVYVYAADGPRGAEEIVSFPHGSAFPDQDRAPIRGPGVNGADWIAVDANGALHVIIPGSISTYAPDAAGAAKPDSTLNVDFLLSNCCARIAAGADGKLYVYLTAYHWAA